MAEQDKGKVAEASRESGSTATVKPKGKTRKAPKQKPPQMLPPWKVLLHNDDKNDRKHVVDTIIELTPLKELEAIVSRLEQGEVDLEDSIALYERGQALKSHCEKKLKSAEGRLEKIVLGAGGPQIGEQMETA